MKTNTGENINVKANNRKKTYTIRTDFNKYRTNPMTKDEFNSAYYWTANDWRNFLKTDDYYLVK